MHLKSGLIRGVTFGRSGIIRVGEQYHVIENDKIFKCQGYHGHLMVIMKSKFKQ